MVLIDTFGNDSGVAREDWLIVRHVHFPPKTNNEQLMCVVFWPTSVAPMET
jgi:hypothetical protein